MKAAVIIYPGSNRDQDMIDALTASIDQPPVTVWHRDTEIPDVDLIVLPGGFSYGDYLRAGAMAARSPVMRTLVERAEKGVAVLGVCNGFQILTETGLLPGALMRNAGLKFVCKDVRLRVEDNRTLFTAGYERGQVIRVPVAHHDGNYFANDETLKTLEDRGQIAFRYCDRDGGLTDAANPNGSVQNIAGIFSETKTVLGMMPHPENLIADWQGGTDGKPLFDGLVEALS